ncbi:MAG TPA: alpha/beta hydrolase [Albitalea sp.]|nr:alpha/beta hydrolase [Albitalea sp.]
MKFVDTALLRVGYDEWNPSGRHTVVLLHGWPDSPRCWQPIAPALAEAGYRVIAPALRGFVPTRFLDARTPRSGQLSALGRDLIEFVQALRIERPTLVGHDWGARAAANACGLAPELAERLVMLSVGYGTNDPKQTLSLQQARNYWYHWYMATERGARSVREDRAAFARMMWDTWSPPGWFDAAEFAATAAAFDGDDWAEVVLHSYRHRWGFAEGDPRYADDEARLNPAPKLAVPTLVLHGDADSCNHPDSSAGKEAWFTGPYRRALLAGVGHFPQREAPAEVLRHLLDFLAPAR